MNILNTLGNEFAPQARLILESFADVDYATPGQGELKDVLKEYDAVLIGLGLNFKEIDLQDTQRLKVIATATTGLDHIDLGFAKKKGIEIVSLRGENDFLDTITGTAELSFLLMLNLLRRTIAAEASVKRYEWNREVFRGWNAYGKTLGIVGLGRLGRWMAKYGNAFGMNVLFTDPHVEASPLGRKVSFEELLAQSDVISIHVHLKEDTENMFNTQALSLMKSSAFLINTSRGKIVDEGAILKALREGRLAGYGADVLAGELDFDKQGFKDYPLVEYMKAHDNVLVLPHIGGMTVDSRIATDIFIAEKLKKHLQSRTHS